MWIHKLGTGTNLGLTIVVDAGMEIILFYWNKSHAILLKKIP